MNSSPVGNILNLPLGKLELRGGDILNMPAMNGSNVFSNLVISESKILSNGLTESFVKLGEASAGGLGVKALGEGNSILSPTPIGHGMTTNQINR